MKQKVNFICLLGIIFVTLYISNPIFAQSSSNNTNNLWFFPAKFKLDISNSSLNQKQLIEFKLTPILTIKKFYMAFEFPIQIQIGKDTGIYNDFLYTNPSNYWQFIHSIGYETPHSSFAFHIGSFHDITLGAGSIMNHFQNDLFLPSFRELGLQLYFNYPYLNFSLISSNIINASLTAFDLTLKPFQFERLKNRFSLMSDMSIGITFAYDLDNEHIIYSNEHIINNIGYNPHSTPLIIFGINTYIPFLKKDNLQLGLQFEYSHININNQNSIFSKFSLKNLYYSLDLGIAYLNNGFVFNFFSPLYLQPDFRKNRYKEFQSIKNSIGYYMQNALTFFNKKITSYFTIYGQGENSFSYQFSFEMKPYILKTLSINMGYIKEDAHNLSEAFDPTKILDQSFIYMGMSYIFANNTKIQISFSKSFDTQYKDNKASNTYYLSLKTSFLF